MCACTRTHVCAPTLTPHTPFPHPHACLPACRIPCLLSGIYTLEDLRNFGKKKGWCPYFMARHWLAYANVVVYSYQYMIDPKVSQVRGADAHMLARRACY